MICVVFAICFAHLEYYYIKDPALQISNGKVAMSHPELDRSREVKPIIGNTYQYHLFPILFIFVLISFAALFDDMTFKLFGARKRRKAFILGCANLIATILVEDFAWFVNRWLVPLADDPKAGQLMQFTDWTSMHLGATEINRFVIPNWYLIAVGWRRLPTILHSEAIIKYKTDAVSVIISKKEQAEFRIACNKTKGQRSLSFTVKIIVIIVEFIFSFADMKGCNRICKERSY